MARRVLISFFLITIFGLSYLGYRRWVRNQAMSTGDVTFDPSDGGAAPVTTAPAPAKPSQAILYPPDKSNATAHGQSQTVQHPVPEHETSGAPLADTLTPNPPNGTLFAGTGRYQIYRQGNLTWRVDTNTGDSCVLFATNKEWRKPQVYRNGCNRGVAR